MTLEPDFIAQKGAVEELIKNAGHKCIFFPKFHCELNLLRDIGVQPKRICTKIVTILGKDYKKQHLRALNQYL